MDIGDILFGGVLGLFLSAIFGPFIKLKEGLVPKKAAENLQGHVDKLQEQEVKLQPVK